ncbi:MAG: type II secretion system protein [Methylococcaceae bacterium]|nr:type II secretion system protein [Methylococcaceae bacterium]
MKFQKQQGFTLIELVMVIVILGILAAVALPKFASMQSEARISSLNGALGAIKSATAIVHAKALLEGDVAAATGSVALENGPAATVFNYPSALLLTDAVDLDGFTTVLAAGSAKVQVIGAPGVCEITYTPATALVPATSSAVTTGC